MAGHPRVDFHPEAVAEARAAYAWYERRDPRAAAAFLGELDHAVARVLESPRAWPAFLGRSRRCLFDRFPFFLVYRKFDDRIEVLAVAHAKRRPGYWRDR